MRRKPLRGVRCGPFCGDGRAGPDQGPGAGHIQVAFSQGDIRAVRLGRTFDVVVALFHVTSYQTTNEDLAAATATAATHLEPGGAFLFDCWRGPAVLIQRPEVWVKRLDDDDISLTRVAEPGLMTTADWSRV